MNKIKNEIGTFKLNSEFNGTLRQLHAFIHYGSSVYGKMQDLGIEFKDNLISDSDAYDINEYLPFGVKQVRWYLGIYIARDTFFNPDLKKCFFNNSGFSNKLRNAEFYFRIAGLTQGSVIGIGNLEPMALIEKTSKEELETIISRYKQTGHLKYRGC